MRQATMNGGNWAIVGYRDDPIPDDPAVVSAGVDHVHGVAAEIRSTVAALPTPGQIDAVPWDSQSGTPAQFKAEVRKLPHDLELLAVRYARVGDALATFQSVLANAKAQAQANLAKALQAHNDLQAAKFGARQMADFQHQARQQADTQNASAPPGTPPAQPQTWIGPDFHAQLSDAQRRFDAAKAEIDMAVHQYKQAAQRAADEVARADQDKLVHHRGLFGSILQSVEGDVGHLFSGVTAFLEHHWEEMLFPGVVLAVDAGKWLSHNWVRVLKDTSVVLGTVALVAGVAAMIPVVGEVALPIAAAAAVLQTADDFTLAATGEGKWSTVGIDAANDVLLVGGDGLAKVAEGATELGEASRAVETLSSRGAQLEERMAKLADNPEALDSIRDLYRTNADRLSDALKVKNELEPQLANKWAYGWRQTVNPDTGIMRVNKFFSDPGAYASKYIGTDGARVLEQHAGSELARQWTGDGKVFYRTAVGVGVGTSAYGGQTSWNDWHEMVGDAP